MTARICKYQCGTLLDGWDDNARKYIEAGTGGLHTKERCEEAKAKLEQKNNHGNELVQPLRPQGDEPIKAPYVDHTQVIAKPSEVKIFYNQYPADVEKEYKEFQIGKKFAWTRAQYQPTRDEDNKVLFTICFFYEEIKQ